MKTLNRLLISIVAAHGTLLAQGPLEPPAAPAPTMESLQEIWDKIGGLETQASQLANQNAQLQKQLSIPRRRHGELPVEFLDSRFRC